MISARAAIQLTITIAMAAMVRLVDGILEQPDVVLLFEAGVRAQENN